MSGMLSQGRCVRGWRVCGRSWRFWFAFAVGVVAVPNVTGCGGGYAESAMPNESGDLRGGGSTRAVGTPVGPEIAGSQYTWVEAHCTEGPLDLASRGFSRTLNVDADDEGFLFTYDQLFEAEGCATTLVQRARRTDHPRSFTMIEEARVAQPATEECAGRMEDQRPGEVRQNGQFLEILVQRSSVWCNGLEVRMVYAQSETQLLQADELVRHYVAHFNRRDAERTAKLFAETGSLVEPFQRTSTDGMSRHEGREAIQSWYASSFQGVDWLAMQLDELSPGSEEGQVVADWSYIDPRVDAPFRGRNFFTTASGEIFESRIELTEPPPSAEDADESSDGDGSANGGSPTTVSTATES